MRFIKSPYFQSRNGKKIELVVIHTMVGTYDGTISYFQSNDRQVSAHYLVSLDGDVTQMVEEKLGANHAGITSNPKPPYYKGFNPNWNSIGIENADNRKPAEADRSKQYPALAALVRDICLRNNIPIDRDHICGHRELYDKKTCPGNIDIDFVVKLANGTMTDEMATWLTDLLRNDLGIDTTKSEGDVRSKVGEIKGLISQVESLRKRVEIIEADYAVASGDLLKTKEELRLSDEGRMRVEKEISDLTQQIANRDTQIRKLQEQVDALKGTTSTPNIDNVSFITKLIDLLFRRTTEDKKG